MLLRFSLPVLLLFVFFTLTVSAINPKDETDKVENFSLTDVNGKEYSLTDFSDSKAIVVMFLATQCPIVHDYAKRVSEISKEYTEKGFTFVGINSNKQEDIEEIIGYSEKNNFDFVMLKDWNNVIADQFKASFTPEIYVVSTDLELLYHGRIDEDRKGENIKHHELRSTLDAILAGEEVPVKKTKAFGGTIKRVK